MKKDFLDIYDAFLLLENRKEAIAFLKDLSTPQEISALQERWKICQLLQEEAISYREIAKQTGASLTTIGRVARFLKEEPHGGYRMLLNKKRKKNE